MIERISFFLKFYFWSSANFFIYGSTKKQKIFLGDLTNINLDFFGFDIKLKQKFNVRCSSSKKYIIFYEEF